MSQEIIIPDISELATELKIIKWRKKVGDRVKKGDVLLEIEADKTNAEIESFTDGVLKEILASEGETVTARMVVGLIESFSIGLISSKFADVIIFSILILILIFKPGGLIGGGDIETGGM